MNSGETSIWRCLLPAFIHVAASLWFNLRYVADSLISNRICAPRASVE
jgi:hypothetical protein